MLISSLTVIILTLDEMNFRQINLIQRGLRLFGVDYRLVIELARAPDLFIEVFLAIVFSFILVITAFLFLDVLLAAIFKKG